MDYIKHLTIFILLIFALSCVNKQKKILIVYLTGDVEIESPISCDDIEKSQYSKTAKSLKISHEDFFLLNSFVKRQKMINNNSDCDARIYIKIDSSKICINENNCVCNNTNQISDEDFEAIYILKCRSGYYNYFTKDKLVLDLGIKKFGIPKDYKYHIGYPNIKREEIVKIELIE